MSGFKGTPGPWSAVMGSSFWTVEEGGGQRIANTLDSECVFIGSDEYNHSEANARLIAAAPELLEALYNALAHSLAWQGEPDDFSCSIHRAVVAQCRAAIAKALGEE